MNLDKRNISKPRWNFKPFPVHVTWNTDHDTNNAASGRALSTKSFGWWIRGLQTMIAVTVVPGCHFPETLKRLVENHGDGQATKFHNFNSGALVWFKNNYQGILWTPFTIHLFVLSNLVCLSHGTNCAQIGVLTAHLHHPSPGHEKWKS